MRNLKCFNILLLFIFTLVLVGCSLVQSTQIHAEKGELDLSKWNLDEDGNIWVNGEWEFYWDRFLSYRDLQTMKPEQYVDVPRSWNEYEINGKSFSGQGYATYRIHVTTDLPKGTRLGLNVRSISSAYNLYINDALVAASGKVGLNETQEIGKYGPQTVFFDTPEKEFDLIIHVSNHQYAKGGVWSGIHIGSAEGIHDFSDLSVGKEIFAIGAMVMLAIFNLIILALRRELRYALYFACFCMLLAMVTDVTGQLLLLRLIPLPIGSIIYLWHTSLNWTIFFLILFLHELFKSRFSSYVLKTFLVVNIASQILYTLTDTTFYSKTITFSIIMGFMGILCTVIIVAIGIKNGKKDGWLHIASICVVIIVSIHDFLYWSNAFQSEYGEITIFGVYLFVILQLVIEAKRIKQFSDERNAAELILLQAQIKPHFLYNTLNTIISVSRYDTDSARDLLLNLSNYLRRSFDFKDLSQTVPLKHEIELAQAYVNIERIRFEERLEVNFDVCDEMEMRVPILVLQPIIENAVNHGILPKPEGGIVDVAIKREGNHLTFCVKDNGIGMAAIEQYGDSKHTFGSGVGLSNVNSRLKTLYGKGIRISSNPGFGTEVSWRIPIDRKERH